VVSNYGENMKRRAFFGLFAAAPLAAQSTAITGRQARGITGARWSKGEVPGGTPNGTNLTFTLASTPTVPTALDLYVNGLRQTQGAGFDYTLSVATITFAAASAPQAGDGLFAGAYQF